MLLRGKLCPAKPWMARRVQSRLSLFVDILAFTVSTSGYSMTGVPDLEEEMEIS